MHSYTWDTLPPIESALLKSHGGEPVVVVRPSLVRALKGNCTAAVLLSQLLYWSARTTNEDGWFYNTQKELEEQTGIGAKSQKKARNLLVSLGLIEEKLEGLPARLSLRVNLSAVADLIVNHEQEKQEITVSHHVTELEAYHVTDSDRQHVTDSASHHVTDHSICTKITTETTQREARAEEKPDISDPFSFSVESPLAMAVRKVCQKGLVLSPNDSQKLVLVLRGLAAENATIADVEEFGRKVTGHWTGRDRATGRSRPPGIMQVLEHWREVLSLPEPEESSESETPMSMDELAELAAKF